MDKEWMFARLIPNFSYSVVARELIGPEKTGELGFSPLTDWYGGYAVVVEDDGVSGGRVTGYNSSNGRQ